MIGPTNASAVVSGVDDDATVDRLTAAGARFRSTTVTGKGGKQVLLEDPAGNAVELFEPFVR